MKLIDRNGRLFGLISIVDVLVLLLVGVLALSLRFKAQLPTSAAPAAATTITFTALAEAVPDYVASAIAVGDKVFDKDQVTGGAIGIITAVELLPGEKNMEFTDGTVTRVAVEGYSNVLVTVEGSGLVTDGRYRFNRIYEMGVNASRNLYTKYALFQAFVMDIRAEGPA